LGEVRGKKGNLGPQTVKVQVFKSISSEVLHEYYARKENERSEKKGRKQKLTIEERGKSAKKKSAFCV